MSDSIDLKSNTNYVYLKDTNDNIAVPRTSLSAVDLTAGNGIRVLGNMIYTADATAEDIIHGTGASGVVTPAKLKEAIDDGFLANPDIATVDDILSGSTGQMIDPNGLNSALKVAQAVDVSTLGATTMDGDVSVLNYMDTFTLVGTWDSSQDPNVWVTNKYGFGINGTGDYDPTKYPKYAAGLRYIFIMDIKLVSGQFASILAMNNGRRQDLLIDGGSLSDYNWHRYAFEFDSNAAYFIINITKNSSVQLKNVRQYEVTALTDDAIKALAGFEDPDDFEYSHIIDQNMINPWLQIIDMGESPEVLVYPGLSYKVNAQNHNVKLNVPSIPANKSGLDSYVELYVGGEGSVAVQRPLVLGSTITPYSTNQCTVKFRDGRAVLTIDEVSQDYVVTVTSGVEGDALEGSLYYGLVYATANQIAFNSGLDGEVISLPSASITRSVNILGNGQANTLIYADVISKPTDSYELNFSDLAIKGITATTLVNTNFSNCYITGSVKASGGSSLFSFYGAKLDSCTITGETAFNNGFVLQEMTNCTVTGCIGYNMFTYFYAGAGKKLVNTTFSDCIATGGNPVLGIYNTTLGMEVTNCVFNNPNNTALPTIKVQGQSTAYAYVTISGSTFGAKDNISVDTYSRPSFSGTNVFNSTITGSGLTTLTATSILDLSNNTNAAVASGGTVSAAAGAKIIALGGNTVTISANTSGSYLLNNGTITNDVYLVTVSGASTGSGSLIYGMTASSAGNILFDSSVDGSTITLPSGSSTVSRLFNIVGNGINETIITGGTLYMNQRGPGFSNLTLGTYVCNYSTSRRNLINCLITGINAPFCWYYGGVLMVSCEVTGNTSSTSNSSASLFYDALGGSTIANSYFHDNSAAYGAYTDANLRNFYITGSTFTRGIRSDITGGTITDSVFLRVTSGAAVDNYSAWGNNSVLIDNCIFNANSDIAGGVSPYVTTTRFAGNNKVDSAIRGTGPKLLVADSTLDLSSNTNSVVVYGASPSSASITGTTINVVASTASDAAVGGTATIRYMGYAGQNDYDEPVYTVQERTISGGGAGYIMRNNGAWGVPVTVASGTASGSLYDRLVNGTATDITFAPVVDGTTCAVSGATWTHASAINGAGIDKTTVSLAITNIPGNGTAKDLWLNDMSGKGYAYSDGFICVRNCLFNNYTVSNTWTTGTIIQGWRTGIYGSTFSNIHLTSGYSNSLVYLAGTWGEHIDLTARCFDSVFTGSDSGIVYVYLGTSSSISNCYFSDGYYAIQVGSSRTATVSNCYFDSTCVATTWLDGGSLTISGSTINAPILSQITNSQTPVITFSGTNILNSTVSGAGTVVFADGATVTSTDGNGTLISGRTNANIYTFANNNLLEGVTITGTTCTNSLLLYSPGVAATLKNCVISGNTITEGYLTMVHTGSTSETRVDITGCTFSNNKYSQDWYASVRAYSGKALYITDCLFNESGWYALAVITNASDNGSPVVHISGSTFNSPITNSRTDARDQHGTLVFSGHNLIGANIINQGIVTFEGDTTVQFIAAASIYGDNVARIITVPAGVTLTIKPYGGGSDVIITGPTSGLGLDSTGLHS